MKKQAPWLLAVLVLAAVLLFGTAAADTLDATQRYTYADVPGGVRITYFWGSETELTLPTQLDGKKVVGIGASAFSGMCKVQRLTVPAGITDFAKGAFSSSTLKTLVIQGSLDKLQNLFTFGGAVENLTIDGNVGSIVNITGIKDSLKTVSIGGNVGTIERSAFSNAGALERFTVRGKVSAIKDSAFFYCTSLQQISLGGGLSEVPASCFRGCGRLSVCELGSSIRSVGTNAFRDCASLTAFAMGSGATGIGESAFRDCAALASFTAGGVESIGKNAFTGCVSLSGMQYNGSVGTLGAGAFTGCGQGFSLTVKGSVGTLGKGLSDGLKSIEITGNVDTISAGAFSNTAGPETIHIGGKVGTIGVQAFSFTSRLRSVRIDGGIGTIEGAVVTSGQIASTFARSTALETVYIGGNVSLLGDSMFLGCDSLQTVTIGGTLSGVGRACFQGCAALTSVTSKGGLTSVGEDAFNGCTALSAVTLASGITALPARCFYGCSALKKLDIPDSVTSLIYPVASTATELIVGKNSAAHRYVAGISDQTWSLRGTSTVHQGEDSATALEKAQKIVDEVIRPGMSDYDKALTLHNYLVNHVTYDDSAKAFSGSVDAALLFGEAVCQGYCHAYQLLLSLVGIPCGIEDNPADNHAWNTVYLEGSWYHVDVTWDDGSGTYAFFMVPSEALRGVDAHDKTHYAYAADSYALNYYYKNGMLNKAINRAVSEVSSALKAGKTSFTFSMNEKDQPYGTRHRTALLAAFDQNTFTLNGKPCQLTWSYDPKKAQVTVNVTATASRSGGNIHVLRGDSFTLPAVLRDGKKGTVTWQLVQDAYLPALQGSTVSSGGKVSISSSYTAGEAGLYAWLTAQVAYADGTSETVTWHICYAERNPQPTLRLPASVTEIRTETYMDSSYERVVLGPNVKTVGARAFAGMLSLHSVVVQGMNTVIDDTAFSLDKCDITFFVRSGSKAEAWARQKGVQYVLISD